MPEFYHNLITEKSFQLLQTLKRDYDFVLIGGWAVFLYTQALKSKDIDLIVSYETLGKLKQAFAIAKNERLKKYEIKTDEVDVDIYLPHYSSLGLPVEDIQQYTQTAEGFILPSPEILLLLKIYTSKQRGGTAKGEKDRLDIFSLLANQSLSWPKFRKLVKQYSQEEELSYLKTVVQKQTALPELGLTEHKLAQLKKAVVPELKL